MVFVNEITQSYRIQCDCSDCECDKINAQCHITPDEASSGLLETEESNDHQLSDYIQISKQWVDTEALDLMNLPYTECNQGNVYLSSLLTWVCIYQFLAQKILM